MQFTYGKNIGLQVVSVLLTLMTVASQLDPTIVVWLQQHTGNSKWILYAVVFISLSQAFAGKKAHGVNHDGTPQTEAYQLPVLNPTGQPAVEIVSASGLPPTAEEFAPLSTSTEELPTVHADEAHDQ